MERFTYSRTGGALRTTVTMLLAMLMGDVVVFGVTTALVPGWGKAAMAVTGLGLIGLGFRVLTAPLRTAHELGEQHLVLRFGRFRLAVPREAIRTAELWREPLPRGLTIPTLPPAYRAETDALCLLADRRGLVRLTLDRPLAARLARVGAVEFTQVLLSVDEPERLVAAVTGGAGEAREAARLAQPGLAAGAGVVAGTGPTLAPTLVPTVVPTLAPTVVPTLAPTVVPTLAPTVVPTLAPTVVPTLAPTVVPTLAPALATASATASPPAPATTSAPAIRLAGLTRRYGDFEAVRSLDLTVAPGEVLGFLGANGAGKTTTIKMMTGLLRPTSGSVFIGGQDLWAAGPAARRQLGYVPDVPLLYEDLTAREFLWLVAGLYDLPRPAGRQRAEELLALLELKRWGDHQIRSFSLGMKRKMAIAAALVHRPRILLLDEVTNGLDPRAARDVKDLIATLARDGAAVFLTTHLLDVAEELAHRVGIIDQGELRALGTVPELRAQAGLPDAGLEALFLALTARRQEVGA